MAVSLLLLFGYVASLLIYPGDSLKCFNCDSRSGAHEATTSSDCVENATNVIECYQRNSVCFTETEYHNYNQSTARYGRRWLEKCTPEEEQRQTCFNGGSCLVFEDPPAILLLCGCLSGWEGDHCQFEEIEYPFDDLFMNGIRAAPSRPLGCRPNRTTAVTSSNVCRRTEQALTRCSRHGRCFVRFLSNRQRRPFCACNVGFTGDRCQLRYVEPLKDVRRGCNSLGRIHIGCHESESRTPDSRGKDDRVCVEACRTNECNFVLH